jgi:catechol 2,3-dioxygenase-like lactoylglutathione lyase family enzyme
MIRQIAPQFFTTDIPATLAYYKHTLGFECLGTWQDPPVYAIVARDQHAIHFRCAEPPTANPDKYEDEPLDAYLFVEDADGLYAEYAARGAEFTQTAKKLYCKILQQASTPGFWISQANPPQVR